MRYLKIALSIESLLKQNNRTVGNFCEEALDASTLLEELEETGPFKYSRKDFCEFIGIGESTLSGWLKEDRIPRMGKVAYVLLIAFNELKNEVGRLKQNAADFKILKDGDVYHVVQFKDDGMGGEIGEYISKDLKESETARMFSKSNKAFGLLDEAREYLEYYAESTSDSGMKNILEKLYLEIKKEILFVKNPVELKAQIKSRNDLENVLDNALNSLNITDNTKIDKSG